MNWIGTSMNVLRRGHFGKFMPDSASIPQFLKVDKRVFSRSQKRRCILNSESVQLLHVLHGKCLGTENIAHVHYLRMLFIVF